MSSSICGQGQKVMFLSGTLQAARKAYTSIAKISFSEPERITKFATNILYRHLVWFKTRCYIDMLPPRLVHCHMQGRKLWIASLCLV